MKTENFFIMLYAYFNKNKFFYSHKSGFRALHSTVKVGMTNAGVVLECRQEDGKRSPFSGLKRGIRLR